MKSPKTEQRTRWWRGPRVGLGAMVGAILLVAAACSGDDESATTQDGTSTTTSVATTTTSVATATTVPSTTTTVPPVSSQDALPATDAYFAAFNAGDADAVLALLTTDGSFTERFGSGDQASDLDVADELAFFTGQGTLFKSPSCAVTEDQPVEGTTLSCDYETLDALTQAVDALPVPTTATFTVTPLGISEIHVTYAPEPGQPDFEHVGGKFISWMAFNRFEVTCLAWYVSRSTSCVDSTSVQETREVGLMVARYAEEWAAYLDENGCGYLDGC